MNRDFRCPSAGIGVVIPVIQRQGQVHRPGQAAAVARKIPFDRDCGMSCGRAGSWLHFTSGSTSFGASTLVR